MSWEKLKLGEVCILNYGKNLPASKRQDGSVPVYSSAGQIDFHSLPHVDSEGIIIGRKGSVGKIYFSDVPFFPIDTSYYIIPDEKYNLKFLYYNIQTLGLEDLNSDAAVPGLNRNNAYSQLVNIPPLQTQERIADILSSYDDLIENNLKRIKLLEQAAQNIYKEWFVNLRFPGHEKTTVNEETGLPEGWTNSKYKNHFDLITGKKDANHSTSDGAYPFFTCGKEIIKSPDFSFDCNAVLLAGNGDFNVKYYRGKFQAYQRTYVLSPYNDKELFLLFIHLSLNLKHLTHGSKGSVIKYLTKGMIEDFTLILPSKTILENFNNLCENIFLQIETLENQNRKLKAARGILLPRLMNRTIEV